MSRSTAGSPETLRGWAIPAATDIAFALGVLSLLGPRVPVSLKIFLTALAILDDLGAVIIIAIFYTADLSRPMLGRARPLRSSCCSCSTGSGVSRLLPYLALGAVLWFLVLKSGVHATLAGVALALTIPLAPSPGAPDEAAIAAAPARAWPASLGGVPDHPGLRLRQCRRVLRGLSASALLDPVPLGIALGLFLGKQIGVFGFALGGDPRRPRRPAGRSVLAAILRHRAALRHRLHHEPVHRRCSPFPPRQRCRTRPRSACWRAR